MLKAFVSMRPASLRCFLALGGLALAVFLLGLHYKVSQYDLPALPAQHASPVKLLSENEQQLRKCVRSMVVDGRGLRNITTIASLRLLWLAQVQDVLPSSVPNRVERTLRRVRRCRPPVNVTFLFFRPPPILT